jgi:hypothetical protein
MRPPFDLLRSEQFSPEVCSSAVKVGLVRQQSHGAFANAFSVTTTMPFMTRRWISASTSADCPCSLASTIRANLCIACRVLAGRLLDGCGRIYLHRGDSAEQGTMIGDCSDRARLLNCHWKSSADSEKEPPSRTPRRCLCKMSTPVLPGTKSRLSSFALIGLLAPGSNRNLEVLGRVKTAETSPQRIFSSRSDTGGRRCLLHEWLARPQWLPAMPWLRGILCMPRQRLEYSSACPG